MVRKRRENAKLMIVQRIIQLNDTLVTEVTRWIRQINEIDTILNENSEIEEKDVSMSFRRKEFSQKYKELFKSIKMYDNDLKDRLSKLKESLERENKVLAQVLSQVRVREVTISASLFTSIVEHNKEQVRIYTDLHRNYWNSFFGNILQVVGAFEEEVSEDSLLFVEKFSHLCEVLSSEYGDGKSSIEDLFHHLIECADMLNRYVPENNSKEVFIQGIEENPSAKKFADNYFNSRNVRNQIFSNKNKIHKLILKAREGFKAEGIDDEDRKKLKKFTNDVLKTLFIGIEEFKDKIEDLKVDEEDSDEDGGSSRKVEDRELQTARKITLELRAKIQSGDYSNVQALVDKFYNGVFNVSGTNIDESFFKKLIVIANNQKKYTKLISGIRNRVFLVLAIAGQMYGITIDRNNASNWGNFLDEIILLLSD